MQAEARKRRWRRPRATCAAAHRARVAELTAGRRALDASSRCVGERGTGGGDGGERGGGRRARTDGRALGPAGASCAMAPAYASRRPAGLAQHPRLRLDGQARRGPHAPANKARRRECSSERRLRTQRKAQRKAQRGVPCIARGRRRAHRARIVAPLQHGGSKTCRAGPWRRVAARELGGCKGSRARHVEMRERPHRHKTSSAHSLIVS